jgi:DNA-binding CsgD family transcriptional regulator
MRTNEPQISRELLAEIGSWTADNAARLGLLKSAPAFQRFCVSELASLLGHRGMSATCGRLTTEGFQPLYSFGFAEPEGGQRELGSQAGTAFNHAVFNRWMLTREPLFLGHSDEMQFDAVSVAEDSSFAVHGVVEGSEASHFHFSNLPLASRPRVMVGLRVVIPYLHLALLRVCRAHKHPLIQSLTLRERQLLQLVVRGHTNPQIAKEWARSTATVRNLLYGVMQKFGVSTRAQLAVAAIQMGSFDLSGLPRFML